MVFSFIPKVSHSGRPSIIVLETIDFILSLLAYLLPSPCADWFFTVSSFTAEKMSPNVCCFFILRLVSNGKSNPFSLSFKPFLHHTLWFLFIFFFFLRCHSTHPWRLNKLSLFTKKHLLRLYVICVGPSLWCRIKEDGLSFSPCFDSFFFYFLFLFFKFKIYFISNPTTTTTAIYNMTFNDIKSKSLSFTCKNIEFPSSSITKNLSVHSWSKNKQNREEI